MITMAEETDDETSLPHYRAVQPCLRMLRIMHTFMGRMNQQKVGTENYNDMWSAFQEVLNEEMAPYALLLAQAVVDLEHKFQFYLPEPAVETAH